jgi:hypothetical protein
VLAGYQIKLSLRFNRLPKKNLLLYLSLLIPFSNQSNGAELLQATATTPTGLESTSKITTRGAKKGLLSRDAEVGTARPFIFDF